jgi:hypothetical protein
MTIGTDGMMMIVVECCGVGVWGVTKCISRQSNRDEYFVIVSKCQSVHFQLWQPPSPAVIITPASISSHRKTRNSHLNSSRSIMALLQPASTDCVPQARRLAFVSYRMRVHTRTLEAVIPVQSEAIPWMQRIHPDVLF